MAVVETEILKGTRKYISLRASRISTENNVPGVITRVSKSWYPFLIMIQYSVLYDTQYSPPGDVFRLMMTDRSIATDWYSGLDVRLKILLRCGFPGFSFSFFFLHQFLSMGKTNILSIELYRFASCSNHIKYWNAILEFRKIKKYATFS